MFAKIASLAGLAAIAVAVHVKAIHLQTLSPLAKSLKGSAEERCLGYWHGANPGEAWNGEGLLVDRPLLPGKFDVSSRLLVDQPVYQKMYIEFEDDADQVEEVDNQPQYYYQHYLGKYNVSLAGTLQAIETGTAGTDMPYFQKSWLGSPPGGLSGANSTAIEYTVYPNDDNFSPPGIQAQIDLYTNGKPNRGAVRILVDGDSTQYVYTLDHEITFYGPFPLDMQTENQ